MPIPKFLFLHNKFLFLSYVILFTINPYYKGSLQLSVHTNPGFSPPLENCISSHLVMGTICLHLVIHVRKEMVIYPAESLLAGSIRLFSL